MRICLVFGNHPSREVYIQSSIETLMLGRQKVLLSVICSLKNAGKPITKRYIDKVLFLLKKEYSIDDIVKFYNFYPHHFGPFSNNYYIDLSYLESRGFIDDKLAPREDIATDSTFDGNITDIISRFPDYNGIIEYVYGKYPEYAVKSVLKQNNAESHPPKIFSIGYEKKDIDSFLDLLIRNGIEMVVDVRANPFSMNFAFTRSKLERSLEKTGISYMHIPNLGIDGSFRKKLSARADYDELFAYYSSSILPKNMEYVKKVISLGASKRIALLCFESDHDYCHRGTLSSKITEISGQAVEHL